LLERSEDSLKRASPGPENCRGEGGGGSILEKKTPNLNRGKDTSLGRERRVGRGGDRGGKPVFHREEGGGKTLGRAVKEKI